MTTWQLFSFFMLPLPQTSFPKRNFNTTTQTSIPERKFNTATTWKKQCIIMSKTKTAVGLLVYCHSMCKVTLQKNSKLELKPTWNKHIYISLKNCLFQVNMHKTQFVFVFWTLNSFPFARSNYLHRAYILYLKYWKKLFNKYLF